MHIDEIRARVARILVETLAVHQDQITDSTLLEDIASDSLEITQTVMEVETMFGIEIGNADTDTLTTVRDLISLVAAKQKS